MAIHTFIQIKFRIIQWLKRNMGTTISMALLAYHLLLSEKPAMGFVTSFLFSLSFSFFDSIFNSGILGCKFQVLYYRSGSILNYFFTEKSGATE